MIHFELVSPEKCLRSEEAYMVVVPGAEGDFAVLDNHAAVISAMRQGIVCIYPEEGADGHKIFVDDGFAEVNRDGLTILAEFARNMADVTAAQLQEEIKKAEIAQAKVGNDWERSTLGKTIDRLQAMIDIKDENQGLK